MKTLGGNWNIRLVGIGIALLLVLPLVAEELRVVSLAPSLTESVFQLGAAGRLVGRCVHCNFPPEAKGIPVVGGLGHPYAEALTAVRPQLVLVADRIDPNGQQLLEHQKIPFRIFPGRSLDDYLNNLLELGKLLKVSEQAEAIVRDQRNRLEELRRKSQEQSVQARTKVLILLNVTPLMAVGRKSFLHEIIELAGGINVAESIKKDYFILSAEQLVLWKPDLVLLPGFTTPQLRQLEAMPAWKALQSEKRVKVDSTIDPDLLLRLGPRSFDAIEMLHKKL